nr:hypothetical protein [Mycoplasmopsis bovis]
MVYLNLITSFFKNWWAYSISNFLDRINEFKVESIIDGTLKSYNSDEVTFSQYQEKAG